MRELGPLLVSAAEPSADAGGRCAAIGTAAAPARKLCALTDLAHRRGLAGRRRGDEHGDDVHFG